MGGGLDFGRTFGGEVNRYPPSSLHFTGYPWPLIDLSPSWLFIIMSPSHMHGTYNSSETCTTVNLVIWRT